MKVQLLHIADCPNREEAGARLRRALDTIGQVDVPVEFVLIRTPDEATNSGFAGSPTIVVDGEDLFPSEGTTADLACRVCVTDHGVAGAPTLAQLERALQGRA